MNIHDLQAIDVHGHYGDCLRPPCKVKHELLSATAEVVAERARRARTSHTIVSPLLALLPRGGADSFVGNEEARAIIPKVPGLYYYAVLNPLQARTFDQAAQLLQEERCLGIKVHPEEHCYPIEDHAESIYEFAAAHQCVILTHTGDVNSMPQSFVQWADAYPNVQTILAHLGWGYNGDVTLQVRAIQAHKHGNLYVDTSSGHSILSGLIEWAVREIGPQRILYGTDTPLYSTCMQRVRIDEAEIADSAKRMILRENALKLFGHSALLPESFPARRSEQLEATPAG